MREKVYDRLVEAQTCNESGDLECMRRAIEQVRAMSDLNSYEMAQMWSFYAQIHLEQDNYAEAIRAFENLLAQEDITLALESTALYSIAALSVQQEQYERGLEALDRWFALEPDPSVDPYVLKAQILYELGRHAEAIEPLLTGMGIAAEQGREAQEGWYQLLNILYFELEDYAKVIETTMVLVERWTKPEYLLQLAGVYSQLGQDQHTLALYEAAHEAGWLTRSGDLVTLASLLVQADVPYKAARILEAGLAGGTVESNLANRRLLAQAWQLAHEDEKALPAFAHASKLAPDGELDLQLAQSYTNLARWEDCIASAREALSRELEREDQAYIVLGNCLANVKRFAEARQAFEAASRDERSRRIGEQWLVYLQGEEAWMRALENMRDSAEP